MAETLRNFHTSLRRRTNAPSEDTVRNLARKFEETDSVGELKPPSCARSLRTDELIVAVQSVKDSPETSDRRGSQKLGMKKKPCPANFER